MEVIKQNSPLIVVSPMAGITDAPFRRLACELGADYAISEMITSQTKLWESRKTQQRLIPANSTHPHIIQIAGASPSVISEAAQACQQLGATALEINMGCPAKKVCNVLAGSALLRDENLVAEILAAAVAAVRIPVYLKTRLGWDSQQQNIRTIAQIAADCGIQAVTIHGRTRADLYNGNARYELIAEVKQMLKIPVFANGDITTPQQAQQVLHQTGADGLYIGRGALGKPWLFGQIKQYLSAGDYTQLAPELIANLIIEHVRAIHAHYGDYLGVRIARKHLKWYLAANPELFISQAVDFQQLAAIEEGEEQLQLVAKWLSLYVG